MFLHEYTQNLTDRNIIPSSAIFFYMPEYSPKVLILIKN